MGEWMDPRNEDKGIREEAGAFERGEEHLQDRLGVGSIECVIKLVSACVSE